jgi:nucleotide-binding universal stress UspA family protein
MVNKVKSESYFKKILVPVDGSHTCLHAEELAAAIAKNFKSKVTVIHVISHELMHPELELRHKVPSSVRSEISSWFSQVGKKIVWEAEALFKEEGIEFNARVVEHADPAETILRLVKDEDYDLVVMGNRGETEAEVFSLGSVAKKVSRHAECPVFIVKEETKVSKILVGIDGSENAEKALEHAVELAKKHKAKITLLNVGESVLLSLKPEVAREIGESILSDAVAKVKGVEFNTQLKFGNPAETIIKVAEKGNYDIIVVGSRGLSKIKRFFLGSVSDDISHHTRSSVLIVK